MAKQPLFSAIKTGVILMVSILIWLALPVLYGNEYSRSSHILRAFTIFAVVVPMVIISWKIVDKRRLSDLALWPNRDRLIDFFIGIVSWLVPASLGTLVFLGLGWAQIALVVPAPEVLQTLLLLPILVFLYEAFPEELLFRGYIYKNLEFLRNPNYVVAVQAILFALWGFLNGGENSLDRTLLFLSVAFTLGYLRSVTGNFWVCVGFHLAFQTVAQLLSSIGGQFSVVGLDGLMVVCFVVLPIVFSYSITRSLVSLRSSWKYN